MTRIRLTRIRLALIALSTTFAAAACAHHGGADDHAGHDSMPGSTTPSTTRVCCGLATVLQNAASPVFQLSYQRLIGGRYDQLIYIPRDDFGPSLRLRRIINRANSIITEPSESQAAKNASFGIAKISESRSA